jgi:hypothetical protein
MEWIDLALDKDQWMALVNTVMNLLLLLLFILFLLLLLEA